MKKINTILLLIGLIIGIAFVYSCGGGGGGGSSGGDGSGSGSNWDQMIWEKDNWG